ncbi:unnamed protein product [Lepeophtheirus salmonis]|uniref:(salmon louse) hypothetical protein n=1 Tax=Lepeophtheirus salmonis TaxID=72036 RepID=A0A7R8CXR8_LEPSM|nr:unnamed protein product [Lepeophtheirus salmonis]CAF2934580.1 unnamed protein product [Lepeophtheirus salmonis]
MYSSLLLQELTQQRLNETHCDVKLSIGSSSSFTPIKAHACILEAESTFFQNLFDELSDKDINLLETSLANICKSEVLQNVLPGIINAIYTGHIPPLETKEEMMLFDAFGFKHLSSPNLGAFSLNQDHGENSDVQTMDVSFCHKCHLLFTSKEEFFEHRPKSQKDLEIHIKLHAMDPEKPYFCLQCDSRFPNKKTLNHHLPKHSIETPHVCNICTKGFKWKHSLASHMATHSSAKKFNCEDCGFSTSQASTFKLHSRIHSGKTHKCPVKSCPFQTVRKQNLVQHSLTHFKVKPYQCELCGKAFSLAKNMRRHRALHHDPTTPKYTCDLCSYSTVRSDKYMEHLRRNHPEEKDRLIAEKKKAKENIDMTSKMTSFNHIFEPINPPNKMVTDGSSDTFVETLVYVFLIIHKHFKLSKCWILIKNFTPNHREKNEHDVAQVILKRLCFNFYLWMYRGAIFSHLSTSR